MGNHVILVDSYNFTIKPQWQGARPESRSLPKGTEVDEDTFAEAVLGAERELQRGLDLGGIGPVQVLRMATAAAASGTVQISAVNDSELANMSVEDIHAHVGQYPDELDRVLRLEALRPKPRKGVLALSPDFRPDTAAGGTDDAGTPASTGDSTGDTGNPAAAGLSPAEAEALARAQGGTTPPAPPA